MAHHKCPNDVQFTLFTNIENDIVRVVLKIVFKPQKMNEKAIYTII